MTRFKDDVTGFAVRDDVTRFKDDVTRFAVSDHVMLLGIT